ncbi:AI-2E family transporter [Pistricoccus aurantiacus]|uniref:AI-2E family transporter n=1 Tax=Pistricoccus aurantiacus TaxID=1883414 RepID=UPI0036279FB1
MSKSENHHLSDYARRVWVTVGIVVITMLLLLAIWFSLNVLLMVFAGLLVTLFFSIPTNYLHQHSPLSRGLSLLVVMLVFLALLVGFFLNFALGMNQEFERLLNILPDSWSSLEDAIRQYPLGSRIIDRFEQFSNQFSMPSDEIRSLSSRLTTVFSSALGAFLNVFAVVLIGLFVLIEPDSYKKGVIVLVTPARRDEARGFLDLVYHKLTWWLVGRLISMSVIGLLFGLGLWGLGVPMALSLGILAGLLSFIPYLGPVLAAIPALLVAFTQGPTTMLYVGLLYLAIQFLESNIVTPLVQRKAVSIPPALLLVVQLWLGIYTGILGLLLAEPLIVMSMLIVQRFYVKGWLEDKKPTEAKEEILQEQEEN